ncbi:DUF397 domain-containing protein [Streptomyces olivoreticuli]|uniref:DUF397 domain-containing protein n=1 Tax=Streptomyces olivoreticuli TaxID=68246 RepID=UPI000E26A5BD|nr:DUF397 domain-containing protein [Streptomyces olivoreticuli]
MTDASLWFKSSYSSDQPNQTCVEVANRSHTIHVRDSKLGRSPQLAIPAHAWADFITYASAGA